MTSFDQFSQEFQLSLHSNRRSIATFFGTFLSCLTFVTLIMFMVLKYSVMVGYDDTNIMFSDREYFYSDDVVLS